MLNPLLLFICLMALSHPHAGYAQDTIEPDDPVIQRPSAWQKIQDFEATRSFAVIGPPIREDAGLEADETKLYKEMVEWFDDLEDEDDDYLFVIEAILEPDDSSRPASLRNDDDLDNVLIDETVSFNFNPSVYIDRVRPTFLPGVQIKPRSGENDKKENSDARSLFSDLSKPKADDILGETNKPKRSDQQVTAEAGDGSSTAGSINAPPKKRISPDEETLNQLKQAVKELGLEKRFDLGRGTGGHQMLEHKEKNKSDAPVGRAETTSPPSRVTGAKTSLSTSHRQASRRGDSARKKDSKSRVRMKAKPKIPTAPVPSAEPETEGSGFLGLF